MTNHLHSILTQWYSERDALRWVLATVVAVEGSNYRKIGAMILMNELGQFYGLISGGCLEKSLLVHVKKVLTFDRPLSVQYDSSEQSDIPWAMALGCGGIVTVLLQPVHAANHYHQLDLLYSALKNRIPVRYGICLTDDPNSEFSRNHLLTESEAQGLSTDAFSGLPFIVQGGRDLLVIPVRAQIHLAVFGGGLDALPCVRMAGILGWRVTLVDSRSGYAQVNDFVGVSIIRSPADSDAVKELITSLDAAIVMTHNLEMDVAALRELQNSCVRYIGLLGPSHRKQKVLHLAELTDRALPIFGPMGLDIGGDLPESIALATLAQCHQVILNSVVPSKIARDVLVAIGEPA